MRDLVRYWWVGAVAGLWLLGLLLVVICDDDTPGLFVASMGAVVTALAFMRHWTLRTGRAFVHGYHAGYHDASRAELTREPCPILDLAEQEHRRLRRLA